MAQGDLRKLLEDTRDLLMVDTEWYRTFLDVQPHTYTNSVKNVTREFTKEVGEQFYAEHKGQFDKLIKEYVATLYQRIVKTKRNAYEIVERPGSTAANFSVDIIPLQRGSVGTPRKSGNTLVYDSVGSDPFKRIINVEKREALRPLLQVVNQLLATQYTTSTFLDTGHADLGVAEKQTYGALGSLRDSLDAREDLSALAKSSGVLAKLKLTSRWIGRSKTTTISVTDESFRANRSKATGEKFFKANTLKAIQNVLNKTDWANQKGSDSPVEAIHADLAEAVRKAGGKSPHKKADRKSGSATAAINFKAAKTSTKDGGFVKRVTAGQVKDPSFDISMISLLNARLPPAVRNNMTGGALQNRTGRFSESVRITGVERTPQGYPRLLYTYQRAPYDVFDPVLGAPPWATPGRDPKILIDRSIRDVAREMAIGRFYTRRV